MRVVRGRLDRDVLAPGVAGSMAQRERLAMRGVALKPELESFADDSPAYLVERLPILNGAGELRAVCLIALESRTPVPVAEVEWMRIDPQLESAAPGVETAQIDPVIGPCAGRAPLAAPVWLVAGAALKQLEWDAALYHSLLSHFCQRYEGFGVRLAERVAAGRAGELAQELGRLASGARNLGAIPVADLAGEWVEACSAISGGGGRGKGVRVVVIDETERQDGVQNGRDARGGRVRVRHRCTLLQHHVLIAHRGEFGHLEQRRHAHGGETGAFNRRQVPAAAFDVANLDRIAEKVLLRDLHRGVAAAMEDERWISAEQTGGIDALTEQIGSESGGFSVVPEGLHDGKMGVADLGEGRGDVKRSRHGQEVVK